MFGVCRYCGEELERARRPLEVCARCEDAPLCDRCGHPRGDHGQVFVRGVPGGCTRVVGDFQALTSRPCACEGFRPVAGRLADAEFAQEVELPPLRVVRRPAPRDT